MHCSKSPTGCLSPASPARTKLCGCIINTASQITAEPPRLVVTMQKSNFTSEQILLRKSMSISVLDSTCPLERIADFGYVSGRDVEKWANAPHLLDARGNPYLTENANAHIDLTVESIQDVDTHWLFLCDVKDAQILSLDASLTYGDYRVLKAGGSLAQKDAPKTYVCSVCHYVYSGDIPFEELPDDYVCPICGVGKELFVAQ